MFHGLCLFCEAQYLFYRNNSGEPELFLRKIPGVKCNPSAPQSRQSAMLFLQSSELGLPLSPSPHPQPLTPVLGGGTHSLARDGLGESQFRRRDIHCGCITASGSGFHQLLAASKKRRKTTILPKVLEPPAYQASNKGAPSPKGARPSCKGARPFAKGRAPQATSTFPPLHTSTKISPSTPHGLEPPSSTCTNS